MRLIENANLSSMLPASAWYAVYTKHQHEKSAADVLTRKGFEILLPLYTTRHKWKDRSKLVRLPLFPCYVFVRASLDQRVEILKTPGIFWFVASGGHPATVPLHEIDALRTVQESPARCEPHPYLKSGDRVRVKTGSLAGIEGFLVRFKNQSRIVLSVGLLQKSVAVEIDATAVDRVKTLVARAVEAF